jgi:hypothetical protein
MQLNQIAIAKLSELKEFAAQHNLSIEGDRRCRETWENAVSVYLKAKDAAVKTAQQVKRIATSDKAKRVYRWSWTTIVSLKNALIFAGLAAIVLGMLARDAWEAYHAWTERFIAECQAEELMIDEPDTIVRRISARVWSDVRNWGRLQRDRALHQLQVEAIQPAMKLRDDWVTRMQRVKAAIVA